MSQNYEVLKPVGDWSKGNVFSMDQFRSVHPLSDDPKVKKTVNAETYHQDLIDRLLALEAVKSTDRVAGPDRNFANVDGSANASIRESTRQAMQQKSDRKQMVETDKRERFATTVASDELPPTQSQSQAPAAPSSETVANPPKAIARMKAS